MEGDINLALRLSKRIPNIWSLCLNSHRSPKNQCFGCGATFFSRRPSPAKAKENSHNTEISRGEPTEILAIILGGDSHDCIGLEGVFQRYLVQLK